MPIDWKQMAAARGLPITPADLEKMIPVLSALDAAFSPLIQPIAHETEPAVILSLSAVAASDNLPG